MPRQKGIYKHRKQIMLANVDQLRNLAAHFKTTESEMIDRLISQAHKKFLKGFQLKNIKFTVQCWKWNPNAQDYNISISTETTTVDEFRECEKSNYKIPGTYLYTLLDADLNYINSFPSDNDDLF